MESSKKGKLFIVPTPIGNLKDITYRAVEILKAVNIIGAEDTRKSQILLKHYSIDTPMFSYHKFNERSRVEMILNKLAAGDDVAIISDAGTPGISDPAQIIIQAVLDNGMDIETLPGATAFLPALITSGLDAGSFYFTGFLPDKLQTRKSYLQYLANIKDTLIFYEAPHRLVKFLEELLKEFGDRKIALVREISKLYETCTRTSLSEFLKAPEVVKIKGEFVVIVEGAKVIEFSEAELIIILKERLDSNKTLKTVVKEVSEETGSNKNKVYQLALQLRKPEKD
jgi:16S rRNA (cytidine1402-2'-O)-methyltransferase